MNSGELPTPLAIQPAWYAIYTKHQHEKSVSSLLLKRDFEVLLPLYTTVHRWKDRNKALQLPLFPCYVFVRADLLRKTEILRTPGVFFLVESGGRAFPVPECEIDAIKRVARHPTKAGPHPYLKGGDRVRICDGPLTGIEGILVRSKGQFRVILTVELLRQAIAIEVDLSTIERLPADQLSAKNFERLPVNAAPSLYRQREAKY